MTANIRLYVNNTELNYSKAQITQSNDHIVDSGSVEFEASDSVSSTSQIQFRKEDGSTVVFRATIQELKKTMMWNASVLTNGYELMNIKVEQVYENQSPESIVQDVVDNSTVNLTYSSGPASGFTITKYIANAYAIDVIKDMIDLLQWQLRIDENDNVFF